MDGIFTAQNLTKTFGSGKTAVTAVNDVSFALQKGQITTIVGESGSGKSTIARMVLGLLPITSGTLTFQGKDVTNPKGNDRTKYWRDVQAVFQDPFSAFNQFFTVKTLLYRSMRLLNESVGQDRLEEALGHVGMDLSVLDRYPHQLSGGQRQRVVLARALVGRPRLVVTDEPTSMVDATLRGSIVTLMRDLSARHGIAFLVITHDLDVAGAVAEEVAVMREGRIVESGRTAEVFASPAHPYTRTLLQAATAVGRL